MTDEPVRIDLNPPFAHLILNRPERHNALDRAMWAAIPPLLDRAEHDPEIKLLLLSGADSRAFAAGADISEFSQIMEKGQADAFLDIMLTTTRRLSGFSKPTIAVIQGGCFGGGCSLALCCDLRFADETARFGVTPGRLGITYPLEDTRRLVDAVGLGAARDLLMTARIVDASEALRIGLIDRLWPVGRLWDETRAYGQNLAGLSQYSIRASKAVFAAILAGATQETDLTRRLFTDAFAGEDLAEGARAFLGKRPARFTFS
jgi:enoyl-CoA hydratase/carnithine racemase